MYMPARTLGEERSEIDINPLVTNGLSHSYHLDGSTFNFRGIGSNFSFLFHFSMKITQANRIAQVGCRILRRHIWGYSVCLKGRAAYMG